MKKEFIVERQGKSFVLYAGLLAEAHEQGLKSITTELVQIPNEANNRVAICVATVIIARDGIERTFTGIGDAAPNNVAPAMQSCLIRMAETRGKARALRDAVNIGVAALEEMGDDASFDGAPEVGYQAPRRQAAPRQQVRTPAKPAAVVETGEVITAQQQEAIRNLCQRRSVTLEKVIQEKYGKTDLETLTQTQASELIRALNQSAKPAA